MAPGSLEAAVPAVARAMASCAGVGMLSVAYHERVVTRMLGRFVFACSSLAAHHRLGRGRVPPHRSMGQRWSVAYGEGCPSHVQTSYAHVTRSRRMVCFGPRSCSWQAHTVSCGVSCRLAASPAQPPARALLPAMVKAGAKPRCEGSAKHLATLTTIREKRLEAQTALKQMWAELKKDPGGRPPPAPCLASP